MSHLREIVAQQTLVQPELPLIHTTRCEFLEAFVLSRRIEPRPCVRFSENLIYFFYGRPAYRSLQGARPGEPVELCPLCFVLKPAAIPAADVRRVFPCDSGAIKEGVFQPDLDWSDQAELALDPSIESARKFVQLCFRDNAGYYFGRLQPILTPDVGSAFARYCTLVQRAPTDRADDRRSAIEVQVTGAVSLIGQLLFVALPRELFQEPAVVAAIRDEWRCDTIPYPTFIGDAPAQYYSVVRDRVTQWFENEGRI